MSTKSIGRPLMVFRLILIINIVLSLLYFQHMPEFYLFSFRACLKNHLEDHRYEILVLSVETSATEQSVRTVRRPYFP